MEKFINFYEYRNKIHSDTQFIYNVQFVHNRS